MTGKKRRSHRRVTWGLAVMAAFALNVGIFALIPYLVSSHPELPEYDDILPGIRIIRIQEEVAEEPEPIESPEEQVEEPLPEPDRTAPAKPVDVDLTLPFEINPRLPSKPGSLKLPPMATSGFTSRNMFSVEELDQPLTPVTRIPPVYPMNAKRRNIEGWVSVRFVIDEEGSVENVTILDQDPPGVFDRTVMDTVSAWRFRPGTIGGIPVKAAAETTIRFELD